MSSTPKPQIIPTDLQKRIRKAAKQEAASLWEIADLANEVMDHVVAQRSRGKMLDVYDFQVWAAIGGVCAKSGGRVKKLALISRAFPPHQRAPYTERWEFGYFERAYDIGPPQPDPHTGRSRTRTPARLAKTNVCKRSSFLTIMQKGN
jgi:hypothetical protein